MAHKELIIDDSNYKQFLSDAEFDGHRGFGLVPRDFQAQPFGQLVPPMEAVEGMPLIPESEWSARIKEMEQTKSRLSDIRMTGNNGGKIWALNQSSWGYCHPAGTRVRMADGTQKRIEDVKLLDKVLTAEGNIRRVMQCHVRDHDGQMATVKCHGHGHLRLTPNHEVLTQRGYVPAGQLTSDDWVVVPKHTPVECNVILTSEHVRAARKKLVSSTGSEYDHPTMKQVPEMLSLSPGLGRLFGLWLAEGYSEDGKHTLLWAFNKTETDTLAAETMRLIETELGEDSFTQPGPGPNVTLVGLRGKLWCQLFRSLCGALAGGKRVHADLLGGSKEFRSALFWGWMAGDGSRRVRRGRDDCHIGATISHDLAMNMYDIANSLGMNPTIAREKPQVNRHAKKRQPVWKVTVIGTPSDYRPNYRMRSEPSRMWRRVKSVSLEPYKDKVFNLGVEGDNSYVAEGVGVHNCWGHSVAHCIMLARAFDNQPFVNLSAFSLCAPLVNGANRGGWGAWALQRAMEIGIMPTSVWPQLNANPALDTAANRQIAAKYRVTEGWVDVTPQMWNKTLTWKQTMTLLLSRRPTVGDYNWWGHSVCLMDPVEVEPGSFGVRILNSWYNSSTQEWGDQGTAVLRGDKAVIDGGVGVGATMAA